MNLWENARQQGITSLKRGIRNLRAAMLPMEALSRAGKLFSVDMLTAWRERLGRWTSDLAQFEREVADQVVQDDEPVPAAPPRAEKVAGQAPPAASDRLLLVAERYWQARRAQEKDHTNKKLNRGRSEAHGLLMWQMRAEGIEFEDREDAARQALGWIEGAQ